ncbi:MAG: hypothetical protein H6Q72_3980 [Firmicutes bacterium]|nr:hypothetical protein [Bacillota bacterium]
MERPCFKPHLRVEPIEQEAAVLLLSERGYFLLQGRLYVRLAPLLDGSRTTDDLIDILDGVATAAEIYYALASLERKGYLIEDDSALPPEQAAFWSALGAHPGLAAALLRQTTVTVTALGGIDPGPLVAALESVGIHTGLQGTVGVVVTDDVLREELSEYNRDALATGRPWLLIKPRGLASWLGPLFRPGVSGCWQCLASRYRDNREAESFISRLKPEAQPVRFATALPTTICMTYSMAASELAKWLVLGKSPLIEGQLLTIDGESLEIQKHLLARLAACPVCGRQTQPAAVGPFRMVSRKKIFTADGGHRWLTPEETLGKYAHLISPITGVVRQVLKAPETGGPVHVYQSGHNFATASMGLYGLKNSLRSQSAGKGKTDPAARAGALAEAVERYCGVFRGDEPRIRASYRELGEQAIHPGECLLFSRKQYQDREVSNANSDIFNFVPEPFDEKVSVDWTPVWSLSRGSRVYLLSEFCYFAHSEAKYARGCSNGNAAGNVPEEAVLQGFLELVERDSVALWWYNRLPRPRVDLASFSDPYFQELSAYYAGIGREFWLLDITADLGIPTFAAVSRQVGQQEEGIIYAFGTHLDPKVAAMRAVTEMNQMLPFALRSATDEGVQQPQCGEGHFLHWLKTATVSEHPYLGHAAQLAVKTAADYRNLASDDLLTDINFCRSLVDKLGLEMLVLDQTRPDVGMSVVKVIVPGMRHFWRRLAPGRLYDVPVKLGWLERAYREDELNPCSILV